MHLSGSFCKPALLSVDCNCVSVGPLRGSGSQGMSGRGCLPPGVTSAPTFHGRGDRAMSSPGREGTVLCSRLGHCWELPMGPQCPHPCFCRTRRDPVHSHVDAPQTPLQVSCP